MLCYLLCYSHYNQPYELSRTYPNSFNCSNFFRRSLCRLLILRPPNKFFAKRSLQLQVPATSHSTTSTPGAASADFIFLNDYCARRLTHRTRSHADLSAHGRFARRLTPLLESPHISLLPMMPGACGRIWPLSTSFRRKWKRQMTIMS